MSNRNVHDDRRRMRPLTGQPRTPYTEMLRCVCALVALLGCGGSDAAPSGADGGGCVRDEDCGPGAPLCDVASGLCRGCTDASGGQCSRFDDAPYCVVGECVGCGEPGQTGFCAPDICDSGGRCRGCESNTECVSSGACTRGECVAAAAAIYIKPDGSAASECTREDPCSSIARGIEVAAVGRQVIVLADGMYAEAVVVNPTTHAPVTLDLVGDGAIIQRATAGPVVRIRDVPVHLERVVIQGGSGAAGIGIDCAAIDRPNLTISTKAVTVQDNAGGGILSASCSVWLDRGSVVGNGGNGVRMSDGDLDVGYSIIEDNSGLGMIVDGNSTAHILGSWVLGNAGGGVDLDAAIYVLESCTSEAMETWWTRKLAASRLARPTQKLRLSPTSRSRTTGRLVMAVPESAAPIRRPCGIRSSGGMKAAGSRWKGSAT